MRVAIVGAGLMGRWHAYYAAKAGAAVTAIVDRDPRMAATLQDKHPRAQTFTELRECLDRCGIDVVHVCTPSSSHVPLAAAALDGGKHVLVEKPLAGSLAATERLIALARRRDLFLNPTHQFPFQRGVQQLDRDEGRLGEPVRLAFVTCTAGGDGLAPAERRAVLLDILPHPLALFRAVLRADIRDIAWDSTLLTDDDLELRGTLRGVQVHALLSLRGRPTRNSLTVFGTAGTAHVDLFHGFRLIERGRPSRRTKLVQPFAFGGKVILAAGGNALSRGVHREPAYPGLAGLIARFHRAAMDGTDPPIDVAEMVDVAALREQLGGTVAPAAAREP